MLPLACEWALLFPWSLIFLSLISMDAFSMS